MSDQNNILNYLKNVLGVSSIVATSPNEGSTFDFENSKMSIEKVGLLLVVDANLSADALSLIKKVSQMSPVNSTKVLYVNLKMGSNEIEKQILNFEPGVVILFGENLFKLFNSTEHSFFDYINNPFKIGNVNFYVSHEPEDMCKGPNVNLLKKQLWQQLKQISRTP
jgi:hypothetical protein